MIYVHIPFCRNKCFYCGFYSTVSPALKEAFLAALVQEMDIRKNYLGTKAMKTLYFGGGTPSLLGSNEIEIIVRKLEDSYTISPTAERTIEMNPEDISREKLQILRANGFNRLSIGVQSFDDSLLKKINRKHSAEQASQAVRIAAEMGFENIGIDLIIGLPGYTMEDMEKDVQQALSLPISHISTYILSIDPGSVFEKHLAKGMIRENKDVDTAAVYLRCSELLKMNGFEHYEISNFARDGKYSRHNSGYWQQEEYIGFGPSAHSFDKHSRQWNVANTSVYINALDNGELYFEKEELSDVDRYNEYIMTSLRTQWGADIDQLNTQYATYWQGFENKLISYIDREYVRIVGNKLIMTEKGWLISDDIFSDLFVV
ncbi:radical SAM family heme chaperone HemW [Porphyromonadaceae bacterium OttesenSCG-928-L07]|nr:radical SAM family heme chaperone HemW [Porphyromonadaceae bacterium OttesenSCG-928-L07]MDL2330780.1 radical SAM family heme chaperone HemW [Odoribacter sp. OttesenSCG-928-A06]